MAEKLLYECETGVLPGEREDEAWQRFQEVAHRAGYTSAVAAADACGLWSVPVVRAIALLEQEVKEGK